MTENSRQAVYLGENTVLTRLEAGHKIYVDTRDRGLAPHIILDGFWEPEMTRAWRGTLRPGMTVIDVGSNIGYYALLAAGGVGPDGTVVAFEPDPRLHDLLFANLDVNGYRTRSRCVAKAVTDAPGWATFYKREKYPINSSLWNPAGVAAQMLDKVTPFEVETVDLDGYVRDELDGRAVDLVKIDAEGAEGSVLLGMEQTLARNDQITVLCEFNADRITYTGGDPAETLSFLENLGFFLRYVGPEGTVVSVSRQEVLAGSEFMLYLRRPSRTP